MNAPSCLESVLALTIARFIALKQALGREYAQERTILAHLDAFLHAGETDLTAESFAQWCRTREDLSANVRRRRMRVVQDLCLYRRRYEPHCFVPDTAQFPPRQETIRPYIFTEQQIASMLLACDRLQPTASSPLRSETYRLALVLLYTTGIRRGELLRLTVGDYEPRERTLLVLESKFHKSRVLPLSCDASAEVDRYLALRRAGRIRADARAPLLASTHGGDRSYSGHGLGSAMKTLMQAASVRTAAGALPRVHDFRHTFAVHALMRWYRIGADVQAKLPSLATYMGHISILSTQYYLRFLDPLTGEATELFERRCGGVLTPQPTVEGWS